MKLKFVAILLFIGIIRMEANPIREPWVEFSELQFREDGSWILEISVFSEEWLATEYPIEEIWIKSNSGESKLKEFVDDGSNKVLVIENDDLINPLTINPTQDNVSVGYVNRRSSEVIYCEPAIYGFSNSKIRTPKNDQSIASLIVDLGLYSITKSPSIGFENDTTGMMGIVKGIIYDKDGLPLNSDMIFNFHYWGYNTFFIQPDGSYSTRFYSNDFINVGRLGYSYKNSYKLVDITPFTFSMQPDSVVICDIYLTEDILAGINEINNGESILKIYPQPVKLHSFNYEVSIPIKSLETYLVIRNITGQEICKFSVKENKGTIILPENIKTGSYILQLISNKKNYVTTKLIVQ